jgi:WD40 repeat protein
MAVPMPVTPILTAANSALFQRWGRHLTDVETTILLGAIAHQTYEEIADSAGYAVSYLKRDVGPKLWRNLSAALGETISKTNFRAALERYHLQQDVSLTGVNQPDPAVANQRIDWGEGADTSVFYGRSEELAILHQWIAPPSGDVKRLPCRLLAILGMGGIGKSTLAIKLAQQFEQPFLGQPLGQQPPAATSPHPDFECILWRSLRNAPPLATLLADLVPFVSDQQDTAAEVSQFIQHLRTHRSLIILDNLETILNPQQQGHFREGYEDYAEFLQLVGAVPHQSCMILTSREKPGILATLESEHGWVHSLRVQGSPDIAQEILQDKHLSGNEQQRQELAQRFGYSPLALKIIATTITDLFAGEIATFLAEDTLIFNGIRRLLDSQFERLSPLETTIMYWLAINREWTSIAQLATDILPPVSRASILEALEALTGRSLIEQQNHRYTQQPVVMEYVNERLTHTIMTELQTGPLSLLLSHALLKTTVKDYIRESQARLILNTAMAQVCRQFSDKDLANCIQQHLATLRQSSLAQGSYGAGNLLNLCLQANIDLAGFDFSGLTLRHVYLQNITLRDVDFRQTHFVDPAFTQRFGSILSLDFSNDGEWMAVGDTTGQVQVWHIRSAQPHWIQHHGWATKIVRFSPDSTRLATGSYDTSIKIWDVQTQSCLHTLTGHQHLVPALAWSHDGQFLWSADIATLRLWNTRTGEHLRELALEGGLWITPHPQQDLFAISVGNQVQIWQLQCSQLPCPDVTVIPDLLATLVGHTRPTFSSAWHPDGRRLATASHDQTIQIWDTHTATRLITLTGHSFFWTVFWLTETLLVSGDADGLLQIWDIATGQCQRVIQAHNSAIRAAVLHPNRLFVATGSNNQTAKIWHTQHWNCLKTLAGYVNSILSLALSPDQGTLAVGSEDQTVRLWNLNSLTYREFHGHTSGVWSVNWHPQGHRLASGSEDRALRIWDVSAGKSATLAQNNFGFAMDWHPDGVHLAILTVTELAVEIWNVATQQCVQTLTGLQNLGTCLAWSPDGQHLAAAGYDLTVRIWHRQTGVCVQTLRGHTEPVMQLDWSPNGEQLATASYDCTIRVWQVDREECVQTLIGQQRFFTVKWDGSGQRLASADQDGYLQIWDIHTGQCLHHYQGHRAWVFQVLWRQQDTRLISGSCDGFVKIWDLQTGKCLHTLQAHRPYEKIKIQGVTGISLAQRLSLIALGAKD